MRTQRKELTPEESHEETRSRYRVLGKIKLDGEYHPHHTTYIARNKKEALELAHEDGLRNIEIIANLGETNEPVGRT